MPSSFDLDLYIVLVALVESYTYFVAFVVQPIAMQYTTASHTGVIFALEPVFAAIVAVIFANEILSGKSYLGAALMMASIFVRELDFKTLIRGKKES